MGTWTKDVIFALRMMRKAPGATAVALLTLILGIGANTAIFSVVDAVLLRPLPFPEAKNLVQVVRTYPEGGRSPAVSVPKFVHWKDNNQVFEKIAAYDVAGLGVNITGEDRPERVVGYRVTGDFFSVFGVPPALGRDFLAEEDRPGAPRVAVLSHELWTRRFANDPSVVGTQVTLADESTTVVGVMPRGFAYPLDADVWVPLQIDPTSQDSAHFLHVTGKLEDGFSVEQADAELRVAGERYVSLAGGIDLQAEESVAVQPLQEFFFGDLRPAFLVLAGTVTLVLLIACTNVANIKLARSMARQKEIAIRTVLGAGASRIVRQFLTEGMVLSILGGVGAVFLCSWLINPLMAMAPFDLPLVTQVGINATVLLFTLAVSIVTGLMTGIAPALHAARGELNRTLKDGGALAARGRRGSTTRTVLVAGELALTFIVVVGAAMMLKSFARLRGMDPGFDPNDTFTVSLSLGTQYRNPTGLDELNRQLIPSLGNLPGVDAAGAVNFLPLEPGWDLPFIIEGRYDEGAGEGWGAGRYRAVSTNFFDAMGISLLRGRGFTEADAGDSGGVVIINRAASREFFPDENPIGKRIVIGPPAFPGVGPSREIVGIAADVREAGLETDPPAILYVPLPQLPERWSAGIDSLDLVIRSGGSTTGLAGAVRDRVHAFDPELPVTRVLAMKDLVARSLGPQRFNTFLMSGFSGLALLLAAVGTYGVLSYLVGQRTQEIGIRMALGARHGDVMRMVMMESLRVLSLGLAIGVAGALALNRFLSTVLFNVSGTDPISFVSVGIVLTVLALTASFLPARRATKVEPLVALRYE